jgi:hypothetical protein
MGQTISIGVVRFDPVYRIAPAGFVHDLFFFLPDLPFHTRVLFLFRFFLWLFLSIIVFISFAFLLYFFTFFFIYFTPFLSKSCFYIIFIILIVCFI